MPGSLVTSSRRPLPVLTRADTKLVKNFSLMQHVSSGGTRHLLQHLDRALVRHVHADDVQRLRRFIAQLMQLGRSVRIAACGHHPGSPAAPLSPTSPRCQGQQAQRRRRSLRLTWAPEQLADELQAQAPRGARHQRGVPRWRGPGRGAEPGRRARQRSHQPHRATSLAAGPSFLSLSLPRPRGRGCGPGLQALPRAPPSRRSGGASEAAGRAAGVVARRSGNGGPARVAPGGPGGWKQRQLGRVCVCCRGWGLFFLKPQKLGNSMDLETRWTIPMRQYAVSSARLAGKDVIYLAAKCVWYLQADFP